MDDIEKHITIHITLKYLAEVNPAALNWTDAEVEQSIEQTWREFIPERFDLRPEDTLLIHVIVDEP